MKQVTFDKKAFSVALKKTRLIDRNLKLRDVAKQTGISPSTISRCESGGMPDVVTLFTLCSWMVEYDAHDFVSYNIKRSSKNKSNG